MLKGRFPKVKEADAAAVGGLQPSGEASPSQEVGGRGLSRGGRWEGVDRWHDIAAAAAAADCGGVLEAGTPQLGALVVA